MERLTKRNENGVAVLNIKCPEGCEHSTCSMEEGYQCQHQCKGDIIEKLAQYEDLEEQGLLLRLPCKVGYTVYCIYERYTKCSENEQEFDEYSCQGCECLECDSHKELYVQSQKAYSLDWIVSNLKRFGKTVFLTQAEAEKKLKETKDNYTISL